MRYIQALDLKPDEKLIAEYEKRHEKIWPEIAAHLREAGIIDLEIYRLGTRLCMVMEVHEAFSFEKLAALSQENPQVQKWEEEMWKYQSPTPWTPPHEKWVPMKLIFSLDAQDT